MDRIGVAVIGAGFMGKCHAQAWRVAGTVFDDLPAVSLELLCDIAPGADALASAWGFARAAADWRAVLDDPHVQVVSITTPNHLHPAQAQAALAAGKHVWCEKPMAPALAEAEAMAASAAAAGGCRTRLGYNYAANPLIDQAAALIAAGVIGTPLHFRGVVDEDYLADPALPWSWRCQARQAGLGALGDIGVHLVSLAHRLLGPIRRVTGTLQTVHRERQLPGGGVAAVENDDAMQALVQFAGGASGVLSASRLAWGRKNRLGFEVQGSAGTLCFDQERLNELHLFTAGGDPATSGFRRILAGPAHPPYGAFCPAPGHQLGFNDLKVIECASLLRGIAGGTPVRFDFAEGLAIERVVHAIARSAAIGAPVEVAGQGASGTG